MSDQIIKISYKIVIRSDSDEEFDQKLSDFMEYDLELPSGYMEDSLCIDVKKRENNDTNQ